MPMETNWFAVVMKMRWTDDSCNNVCWSQEDGPEPQGADAEFGQVPAKQPPVTYASWPRSQPLDQGPAEVCDRLGA